MLSIKLCPARFPVRTCALLGALVVLVIAKPALGADLDQPSWLPMAVGLFGGLALFLFGMEQMTTGLKAAAGDQMKFLLGKLSSNRVTGAITGAIVTAVIQSSSVTTVLVVGFVSAGLMTMTQSIGIIFGANVGTTVTAQIVAFNITAAALPMITIGFAMIFTSKGGNGRHYGAMLMGLGLIFFGMNIMGEAMAPLRTFPPFLELMQALENPLLGILVAAVFTALVQSSSATISLAVVMATQGFVTLAAGIPIVFGAKIGTCITAMLAAIGKPREAVQAASVHVIYNVLGALIWLPFVSLLADAAIAVSPTEEHLGGAERLAAEVPRQIANAASIWATANVIIFLPFVGLFAGLVQKLIPVRPEPEKLIIRPKYLDDELIGVPALALERVQLEIGHMGEWVRKMLDNFKPALEQGDAENFNEIVKDADRVVLLRDYILDYARRISQGELTDKESAQHTRLLGIALEVEGMANTITRELVPIGQAFQEKRIEVSQTTGEMLDQVYQSVCGALDDALRAVVKDDQGAAQDVLVRRDDFWRMSEEVLQRQVERLALDDADRLLKHRLQTDVLDKLRRIYILAEHLAIKVLPDTVVAKELEAQV
ncbi:MAG: Na/Pi cotransporter family protein [Arenicellales bacterium]|nr:Na/Pi cotransporter family protein [Arenicellales bacterium]